MAIANLTTLAGIKSKIAAFMIAAKISTKPMPTEETTVENPKEK